MNEDDLKRAREGGKDLAKADLHDVSLQGTDLREADLHGANLRGANLSGADLLGANLSHANLRGASLRKADLRRADMREARLYKVDLREARLQDADLLNADLSGADLRDADLLDASLLGAHLYEADLRGAKLIDTDLSGADLTGARLLRASLAPQTNWKGAVTRRLTISRYQVEYLTGGGQMTTADVLGMDVRHATARLRNAYSGFWQWIHLVALTAFLAPHLYFLALAWPISRSASDYTGPGSSILSGLMHNIWNGGHDPWGDWDFHWSFWLVVFGVIYNLLRAALLWKTKKLELAEEASGLPVDFDLDVSKWGIALTMADYGFFINLLVALVHSAHYLARVVPLDVSGMLQQ